MTNLIYSILPTIAFIVGFYIGFCISKNNEVPKIKTPVQLVKEHQEKKREEKEINILETYVENIDNYPDNQKDIKE